MHCHRAHERIYRGQPAGAKWGFGARHWRISHAEWACGVRRPALDNDRPIRVNDAATPVTLPASKRPVERSEHGREEQDRKTVAEQALSAHVWAAPQPAVPRPSREEAEAAVRTLIAFAGDDPAREGVLDTPKRVVDAYEEIFSGYRECPAEVLDRTFSETGRL